MRLIGLFILSHFLFSCGGREQKRIIADKLTVIFDKSVQEKTVEKFISFWVTEGFLGMESQTITLRQKKNEIYVMLVPTNPEGANLSSEEKIALKQLEVAMSIFVFENKPTHIVESADGFNSPKTIID